MQANRTPDIQLAERKLAFEPIDAWKRLGLIALATDLTSERDFARLVPLDCAGVYTTRIAFENPTTPANLAHMGPRLAAAAELLQPVGPLDAVCYSCTAASVVLGDDGIRDAIKTALPGIPVVTPSAAARMAFEALGVQRLAILTPYLVETSRPMAHYFNEHGFEVIRFECLGLKDDRMMARVSRKDIIAAAIAVDRSEAEAVFLSCTALPAASAIADIEAHIGKPVVTSNQESIWAMLCHAGLNHRPIDHGLLFEFDLPATCEVAC